MTALSKPAFLIGTIGCFLILFMGTNVKAQSVQEIQKQMDDLKQQISLLKTELANLQSVINASNNGNLTIKNKSARTDVTGANYNLTVGGSSNITIAANETTIVGENMTTNIGSNLSLNAGKSYLLSAGKTTMIQAADQISIVSGSAAIILKKNGDIELKGNLILPKASKELLIKGSKISEN